MSPTLKELIREHVELTGSPRGKEILDNFSEFLPKFKKILPYDYDHMLRVIASSGGAGPRRRAGADRSILRRAEEEVRRGTSWAKLTGFMDYARKTSTDVPPLERIREF